MSGKIDLGAESGRELGGEGDSGAGSGTPGKPGKRAERESREAAALRDNLRRRKAGQRPKSGDSEAHSPERSRHGGDGAR